MGAIFTGRRPLPHLMSWVTNVLLFLITGRRGPLAPNMIPLGFAVSFAIATLYLAFLVILTLDLGPLSVMLS